MAMLDKLRELSVRVPAISDQLGTTIARIGFPGPSRVLVCLVCLSLSACSPPGQDEMSRAIKAGRSQIAAVRDFERLFPEHEHNISYLNGRLGTPTWTAIAPLHGRYVVIMVMEVEFTRGYRGIASHSDAQAYINECVSIEPGPGGPGGNVTFSGDPPVLPENGWDRLVEAEGDFSKLGIELRQDSPIEGFAEHWKTM